MSTPPPPHIFYPCPLDPYYSNPAHVPRPTSRRYPFPLLRSPYLLLQPKPRQRSPPSPSPSPSPFIHALSAPTNPTSRVSAPPAFPFSACPLGSYKPNVAHLRPLPPSPFTHMPSRQTQPRLPCTPPVPRRLPAGRYCILKDFRFNTGTPSASEDDSSPGSG